jgi:hypothetical protein
MVHIKMMKHTWVRLALAAKASLRAATVQSWTLKTIFPAASEVYTSHSPSLATMNRVFSCINAE